MSTLSIAFARRATALSLWVTASVRFLRSKSSDAMSSPSSASFIRMMFSSLGQSIPFTLKSVTVIFF